jgi:Fe-S-cluster-containing hydrogenase component 2
MKFNEDEGISYVDLDRCIGCGNCVSACPDEAIVLLKKESELTPPRTVDDLYDVIMANKQVTPMGQQ